MSITFHSIRSNLFILLVTGMIAFALTATGCGTMPWEDEPKTSDADVRYVGSEAELMKLLVPGRSSRSASLLVDVRSSTRFSEGHIPGAINIPIQDLVPGDKRLTGVGSIIVYGRDIQDAVPRAAAKKLITMGYSNVFLFPGGIAQWVEGGKLINATP